MHRTTRAAVAAVAAVWVASCSASKARIQSSTPPAAPASRTASSEPDLLQSAPRDARVLFRVQASFLMPFVGSPADAPFLSTCGVDLSNAVSVIRGAVTNLHRYRAELVGSITAEKIGCLAGGGNELSTLPVEDAAAGVVFDVSGEGPKGAPAPLRSLFEMAPTDAPFALAADVRDESPAASVLLWFDGSIDSTKGHIRVRYESDQQARWGRGKVSEAIAAAAKEGVQLGPMITSKVEDRDLVVETTNFVAAALIARTAFMESFNLVSSGSAPSIRKGDRVLVLKRALSRPVARGDLVAFRCPGNKDVVCIARIVAVGGDSVRFDGDTMFLNGEPVPATKVGEESFADEGGGQMVMMDRVRESIGTRSYMTFRQQGAPAEGHATVTVPERSVFVAGDNRDHSDDSRHYGPVPLSSITGRVFMIWWSSDDDGEIRWSRLGLIE